MEQYTDLTWGSVTDPCRVNCLSDEPSSFHVLQSSESSVLRLFYNLPCRRTRHRELQNSDTGDYVHDRFTALDEYTKGENVFLRWRSKLSWVSGVKGLWEELQKNCRNLTFCVTYCCLLQFRTGRSVRRRCCSAASITAWVAPSEVSFKYIPSRVFPKIVFTQFKQSLLSTARYRRTSLERSWIRLFYELWSVRVAFGNFKQNCYKLCTLMQAARIMPCDSILRFK